MRTVRVLLRMKSPRSGRRQSAKVVTNCRIPGRSSPIQIHVGYISLLFDGGIPQGRRDRLQKNLRKKWLHYFSTEDVDIDWSDAERKLRRLRDLRLPASEVASANGIHINAAREANIHMSKRKASPTHSRKDDDARHVILFLAASLAGNPLKLNEECAEIQRELKMSPNRDAFRFESRWAVSVDELMRHLMELDPTVVHFSGHGNGSDGLVLQDEEGRPQPVPGRALAMMVNAAARNVRVLVLNSCYSCMQALVLGAKIDCVIGMDGAIGDDAARAFAIRFYGALGNGRSIGNAVAHGIAALAAKQLPDEVLPRCLTRDGVDAHQVILARAHG
jgi:CHAT domain